MNNVSETTHKEFISKPLIEHQLVPNIIWDDSFKDNPFIVLPFIRQRLTLI